MPFPGYCPVAVTPQVTTKLALEFAGKEGVTSNPAPCRAATVGLAGHIFAAVELQVTVVQFSPGTTPSVSTDPGAGEGPKFATVRV